MSIDGLGSIIESEDNIRFVDDQLSNYFMLHGNAVSPAPVDDQLAFNDADENYDTDLEEDFPEPPPKEYDPSETRTYLEKCKKQDIIPVKFVVERLGTRSLVMRHHSLGPNGIKPLARALFKNTFIEELDLTDNDIQADGAILLSLTLYENLYITDLNLSENFIGVSGGISLGTMLMKNNSLQRVSLKGNQFTDKVAKVFAEALKENRTLKYLDLSYNEFGEVGGLFLGAGLGANYGLETLNLSWNSIRNKGGVAMAASLRKNECLRSLDLSWNGLAFIGALAFARHLKKNDTLEELDISNNRIGTKGAQRISLALKVNTGLQQFRMGLNPIGEDGIRALINAIKQNMSVKYLGLENITVSPKLHEEICQLEKEYDIVIRTGGQTGHTQNMPLPSGMEILVQFIQDNRMRVKELFFQFDKDQSGDITKDEFKAGLKECGIKMSETQLDTLIESIDIDNSNTIEYSEILYGKNVVMSDRRFQRKVKIRTERREKESIQLPKLQGFQD